MKIVQMLTALAYGDAIGNDTLAIKELLIDLGYETTIYAEFVDPKISINHEVVPAFPLPELEKNDILIYHLSTGTKLNHELHKLKCKKVVVYHNVTPPCYFLDYSRLLFDLCQAALGEVKQLSETFDHGLADSYFNKSDLINYGYKCPISVRPILIPFNDYDKTPNEIVIKKYNDNKTNILFLGRIAPNKKQEDVISAFYFYKKYYNEDARLFLVGSYEDMEVYKNRLDEYVKKLEVDDVIFTGKISFDEILAYYKIANIFLCMSEHEGFCVPLVEAMYFEVPIIAYAAAAIPETLGNSGVLLEKKDHLLTAGIMDKLIKDSTLRQKVIENQNKRLNDFNYGNVSSLLKGSIKKIIESSG